MSKAGPYEPEAIDVIDGEGRPLAVAYKKRRLRVASIVDAWRIDEEWWREEVSRLYFLVESKTGNASSYSATSYVTPGSGRILCSIMVICVTVK